MLRKEVPERESTVWSYFKFQIRQTYPTPSRLKLTFHLEAAEQRAAATRCGLLCDGRWKGVTMGRTGSPPHSTQKCVVIHVWIHTLGDSFYAFKFCIVGVARETERALLSVSSSFSSTSHSIYLVPCSPTESDLLREQMENEPCQTLRHYFFSSG